MMIMTCCVVGGGEGVPVTVGVGVGVAVGVGVPVGVPVTVGVGVADTVGVGVVVGVGVGPGEPTSNAANVASHPTDALSDAWYVWVPGLVTTCQAACSPAMLPPAVDCSMAVGVKPDACPVGVTAAFQVTSPTRISVACSVVVSWTLAEVLRPDAAAVTSSGADAAPVNSNTVTATAEGPLMVAVTAPDVVPTLAAFAAYQISAPDCVPCVLRKPSTQGFPAESVILVTV